MVRRALNQVDGEIEAKMKEESHRGLLILQFVDAVMIQISELVLAWIYVFRDPYVFSVQSCSWL